MRVFDGVSDNPKTAIIVASFAAWLVMLAIISPFSRLGEGDDAFYLQTAQAILDSHCYCFDGRFTTYRAPGYSSFVALLGANPVLVVAVQAVLTMGAGLIVHWTVQEIDRTIALLAGLLTAASPFIIAYAMKVNAETLYGFLVLGSVALIFRGRYPALAGLMMGAAILTRETLLFLPLLLLVAALLCRRRVKQTALVAGIAIAMFLPWQALGDSRDSRLGSALWIGTWERSPEWHNKSNAFENYPEYAFRDARDKARIKHAIENNRDDVLLDAALEKIHNSPVDVLEAWTVRYRFQWIGTRLEQNELRAERGSPVWTVIKSAAFGLNTVLLLLAIAGVWLARRSPLLMVAVPIVYAAGIAIPFHNTETRYTLFALPFVNLFAAVAIAKLTDRWRRAPATI